MPSPNHEGTGSTSRYLIGKLQSSVRVGLLCAALTLDLSISAVIAASIIWRHSSVGVWYVLIEKCWRMAKLWL